MPMMTLLQREFMVNAPLATAWQHLSRVAQWPTWAKHIKRVELIPSGELGLQSKGIIHLKNGIKSTFQMSEFNLHRNWKWQGPFLWLTVHYNHIFAPQDDQRTKLVWIVEGEGFGVSTLGRLFAAIYKRNLERAIPLLISEMNAINR
jgi:hypothetical protein